MSIDSRNLSYEGSERIRVTGPGGDLRLDCVDLQVISVQEGEKDLDVEQAPDNKSVSVKLPAGNERDLTVNFSGKIPKLLTGLYLAKAGAGDIFTTQFESTGARRMFPCIDHPGFKAVFRISVEIDRDLDAISNMPPETEKISNDRKTVFFRETPLMSTYLLYLGIGKFDSRSMKRKETDVILTAPRGSLTKSDFPLKIAASVLDKFEDYFGIDYALPKLHLISVPEFGAGAMENWGAITFREVYLSIDESTSSFSYKATAEVIAHEIAHQWFGDLVTMEWWNDLWLNESFATFMAYKILTEIHPEWDTLGDMVLLRTEGALKRDSLKNTHPIDADVKSPEDIAQIFDEISYGKGASILRMIEGYVGERNFRDGIRKYLNDHRYGNAKGSDLWSSIEQVSGMPVSRIMEGWIKIQGYPVVSLKRDDGKLGLEQNQFFISGGDSEQLWPIPLTYRDGGTTKSVLMEDRRLELDFGDFLKLNSNFTGFYRSAYDRNTFNRIAEEPDNLTNLDVWGLASDSYNLMLAGTLDREDYMYRIRKIWNVEEPMVINEISNQLRSLYLVAHGSESIRSMAKEFCNHHMKSLGEKKSGEPVNVSVARASVMSTLSLVDDELAGRQAEKFSEYFSLDPDLRASTAISFARMNGSFDAMYSVMQKARTDEDRTKILNAMGWLRTRDDLEKSLDLIRNGIVKRQDTARFYLGAASSPLSRLFMFENMDYAIAQLREVHLGSRTPSRVLEATVPFLGLDREKEMTEALDKYRSGNMEKAVEKALELLSVNLRVKELFS